MKKIISLWLVTAFVLNIFGPNYFAAADTKNSNQFTLRAPSESEKVSAALGVDPVKNPKPDIVESTTIKPAKAEQQKKPLLIFTIIPKIDSFLKSTYTKIYNFIFISAEYRMMSAEFRKTVLGIDDKISEKIFSEIRQKARDKLGVNKIDENKADEAILLIKEKLIPQLLQRAKNKEKIKERLVKLLLSQAGEYFKLVDGYGGIKIDDLGGIAKIEDEDLAKKEDIHEDIWFTGMQAIDALGIIGEKQAIEQLVEISKKGLEAHQEKTGQNAKLEELDAVRRKQDRDKERQLEIEININTEAMRRWTEMEAMLLKTLANLAARSKEKDQEKFAQVNNWLVRVVLDYQSTGEGFYWLRQQAAYRLKDFYSAQTLKALRKACNPEIREGKTPDPNTIYISLNLEAANKEAISLHLASSSSLIYLLRHKTFLDIKGNGDEFILKSDFEEKENRFARLLGIGDALISPEINEKNRIKLLNRLAKIEDNEFALAANILLDTLQEMVEKSPGEIFEDNGRENLLMPDVQKAALLVFLRIAESLKSAKCKISKSRFRPDDFDLEAMKNTLKGRETIENEKKRKVSDIICEILQIKSDADIDRLEKKDICKVFNDIFRMNIVYNMVKKGELTVSEKEKSQLSSFYKAFFGSEVKEDEISEIKKQDLETIFDSETRYARVEIVLNRNEKLKAQLEVDLNQLADTRFQFNQEGIRKFQETIKNVHIILGNMHRFGELKEFKDGENYLKLNRDIIIQSGGGASVAMSGVLERITLSRWLAVISGTDNGGGSLLTRGFNAVNSHILSCAQGDVVRNDAESARMERVPAALITKQLLDYRFGLDEKLKESFKEKLASYRKDLYLKARQSGELDRFEDVFEQALGIAEFVDETGLSWSLNSVKNLLFEGIQYYTGGYEQEFMNPDAIYAGLVAFRDFVGSEGFAVFDQPFGNEMMVCLKDGRECIGQTFFSHTPHEPSLGRRRTVYGMYSVDTYYPEIFVHSRVASAIKGAELIISGLCSWGTSLGMLLKNKGLVKAMAANKKADKLLLTDPVLDDENTLTFWESTVTFLDRIMVLPMHKVWNKVLVNSNEGIDKKWILPARKEMGKFLDAFLGAFGGYRGPNNASPKDIKRLKKRGLKIYDQDQMVEVELQPKRNDPDSYIASILAVPESLAKALWKLMSQTVKKQLKTQNVFDLIIRHKEIEKLFKDAGLSWLSFGMDTPHELICRPDLTEDLKLWLDEGKKPDWVKDKKTIETWFQYTIRKAAANLNKEVDPSSIKIDNFIDLGNIGSKKIKAQFLSTSRTKEFFGSEATNRILNHSQDDKLKEEEICRLGIIRAPTQTEDGSIQILFPNELLEIGDTPAEKVKRIEIAMRFQLEKAEWLLNNNFQDEYRIHQDLLESINVRAKLGKDKEYIKILGELSISLPYLAWLRQTIASGKTPVVMYDMDGTFTAAGTKLTPWMAYCAHRFFRDSKIVKEVLTAQAFEGPMKQIYEEVRQIERRLELAEVRTGIKRPQSASGLANIFSSVIIGGSSGNAVFNYDQKEEGYVKIWQNAIPEVDLRLIELAGRVTMPEIKYEVIGHQIERREPEVEIVAPEEKNILKRFIRKRFAAVAIIPSGRYDLKRDFDINKVIRTKQGMLISVLLQDPEDMLKKIKPLVEGQENEWVVNFERDGTKYEVKILNEQQNQIREMYFEIMEMKEKDKITELKPINISVQPGGMTTNDISPTPKSVGIENGLKLIAGIFNLSLEKLRAGFLGDETATFKLEDATGEFMAKGNDQSVAEEPHQNLDFIAHVGLEGETKANTTTTYNEMGTTPDENDLILANTSLSLKKGEKHREALDKKEQVLEKLKRRGLSVDLFGVKELDEINERQAEEILAMTEITVQEAICNQIKLVQQFVKSDLLTEDEVREIKNLFELTKVKSNPGKQALLYYLLSIGIVPRVEKEEILFEGIKDVSVNFKDGLVAGKRVIEGVRTIIAGKIFADLDNNLVLSGENFSPEMLKLLHKFIMSGVLVPEIVSDNDWENARARLENLPESMRKIWPGIHVDGGAVRCNADGQKDSKYTEAIGIKISDNEFDKIQAEIFQNFINSWQPFWAKLALYIKKNRKNLPNVERKKDVAGVIKVMDELGITGDTLKELVDLFSEKLELEERNNLGMVNYLINVCNLSDDGDNERVSEIRAIEQLLGSKNIAEEKRFKFYQVWAIVEIIRVLNSEHTRDRREKEAILKGLFKIKELEMERRANVQAALKPIRPKLIRDVSTDYFLAKLEKLQKEGLLERFKLYLGGLTTINVKDKNVFKATPIEWTVNSEKIPSELILYFWASDKTGIGTTDSAVAQMLLKKGFENLLVISTSEKKPALDSKEHKLFWSKGLTGEHGPAANIVVLGRIMNIYEQSMAQLLRDSHYHPRPVIEQFREKISAEQNNNKSQWKMPRPGIIKIRRSDASKYL